MLVGAAVSLPLASVLPGAVVLLVGGRLLLGAALPILNVNNATIRQQATPDELLGRAGTAGTTFTGGAMPIGALLGGALGDAFGLQAPLVLGAALTLAALATLLASPVPSVRAADAPLPP